MFYYLSRGEGGPCVAAFRRRRRIQHAIDLREGVDLRGSKRGVYEVLCGRGGERGAGERKGEGRYTYLLPIRHPHARRVALVQVAVEVDLQDKLRRCARAFR